jgi:isoleucyl-tRNA synthetase
MYVAFDVADGKGLLPMTPRSSSGRPPLGPFRPIWPSRQPAIRIWLIRYREPGQVRLLDLLKDQLVKSLGFGECELLKSFKGQEMEYITVHHPLYNRLSTVIVNSFVTEDSGTGVVHTAPDHGVDDFNACLKYGIKPFCPVDERGVMHLEKGDPCDGKFYEEANDIVIEELKGRMATC